VITRKHCLILNLGKKSVKTYWFRTAPTDPATFAGMILLLSAVASVPGHPSRCHGRDHARDAGGTSRSLVRGPRPLARQQPSLNGVLVQAPEILHLLTGMPKRAGQSPALFLFARTKSVGKPSIVFRELLLDFHWGQAHKSAVFHTRRTAPHSRS
jgi:hypothetical protein